MNESTIDLRIAGLEAIAQLAALWTDTFKQAYSSVHSPEDIEAYCAANYSAERARETLSDPKQVCKIAYRRGVAAGFYIVKNHACPIPLPGASAELKQIYVLSREYGAGLGQTLFEDAIETARAMGAAHMWLAVADHNCRAQSFYKKHEFAQLGPGPVFEVGADRAVSTLFARRL